ncbi:MAG: helix-turn-helix domain-containing protein [Solirubrobacterales bacterium]
MTANTQPTEYLSSRPQPLHASAAADSAEPNGVALALDVPGELVEQIAQRAAAIMVEHKAPAASPWLTVGEAADYLRCPKSRVYSLVSAGRIPFVKDGSRTLFSRSELDAWLHNGGGKRP